MLWTAKEVSQALGVAEPSPGWSASGVSIDSRTLEVGDIFIALKGHHGEGHLYVRDAAAKGASAVITNHQCTLSCPVIEVPDTLSALQALAQHRRQQAKGKIIAITGSVGKTTTKEFFRQIAAHLGPTSASVASYNNHWGVPLSLARLPQDAQYGIFEIGMNQQGEISALTKMVAPEVAIITLIAEAHIGHMGSLAAIAEEKAAIFEGLQREGIAVLNADDPFFPELKQAATRAGAQTIVSFGSQGDVRLVSLREYPDSWSMDLTISLNNATYKIQLPFLGQHRAISVLAVIAALKALQVDFALFAPFLSQLNLQKGRGGLYRLGTPEEFFTLIDDAYNANPTSMKAALSVLAAIRPQASGRRIAVLGAMAELGDYTAASHRQLADLLGNVDMVFSCGQAMRYLHDSLAATSWAHHALEIEELIPKIKKALLPGDVILVKGSKSSGVAKLVEELLAEHPVI